jgi:hypothetical protein
VLPRAEVDALTRSLAEVLALAEDGQVADGYELLLWGVQRAEAARNEGGVWGDELVSCWEWALADYTVRYGLPRDPTGQAGRPMRRALVSVLAAATLFGIALGEMWFSPLMRERNWDEGPGLRGASLAHSRLRGVDLAGLDLRRTVLRGAVLTGSSLMNADLTGADLTRADLTDVRLEGANLTGAQLQGADLSRALGLHKAVLSGAGYDSRTRWPNGFDPRVKGAFLLLRTEAAAGAPSFDPAVTDRPTASTSPAQDRSGSVAAARGRARRAE